MYPILFSIGSFHLYSISVAIVVAWLAFSFLFWRSLRAHGIGEDAIFDLTFYATLVAFIAARVGFILLHWELFVGKSFLLIPALWVAPGLSWLGGLVGSVVTLVFLCRQRKIRLGQVLDALPWALGFSICIGKFGSFLGEIERGALLRVPVQAYEIATMFFILLIIRWVANIAQAKKKPYGMVGVLFFTLYTASMFALEFIKDSRVYWGNISANQWILIAIFAESIGVFYVRGGGREYMRPFFRSIGTKIYAKISARRTERN